MWKVAAAQRRDILTNREQNRTLVGSEALDLLLLGAELQSQVLRAPTNNPALLAEDGDEALYLINAACKLGNLGRRQSQIRAAGTPCAGSGRGGWGAVALRRHHRYTNLDILPELDKLGLQRLDILPELDKLGLVLILLCCKLIHTIVYSVALPPLPANCRMHLIDASRQLREGDRRSDMITALTCPLRRARLLTAVLCEPKLQLSEA